MSEETKHKSELITIDQSVEILADILPMFVNVNDCNNITSEFKERSKNINKG